MFMRRLEVYSRAQSNGIYNFQANTVQHRNVLSATPSLAERSWRETITKCSVSKT